MRILRIFAITVKGGVSCRHRSGQILRLFSGSPETVPAYPILSIKDAGNGPNCQLPDTVL
jgi:hypothetical protein